MANDKPVFWPLQIFFEAVPPEETIQFINMSEDLKGKKIPEYEQGRADIARELWNNGGNYATVEFIDELAAVCGKAGPEKKAEALKTTRDKCRADIIADMRRRALEDRDIELTLAEAKS